MMRRMASHRRCRPHLASFLALSLVFSLTALCSLGRPRDMVSGGGWVRPRRSRHTCPIGLCGGSDTQEQLDAVKPEKKPVSIKGYD
eukprot:1384297-Amorphochlora_amoeboformis.AAC.1